MTLYNDFLQLFVSFKKYSLCFLFFLLAAKISPFALLLLSQRPPTKSLLLRKVVSAFHGEQHFLFVFFQLFIHQAV